MGIGSLVGAIGSRYGKLGNTGKGVISSAMWGAGLGAIQGGISSDSSIMGGAIKGAAFGAALPSAMNYGGKGLQKLGGYGVSKGFATSGAVASAVGGNLIKYQGGATSMLQKGASYLGNNLANNKWGMAKSVMKHTARPIGYAAGGAALGAAGYAGADFANMGAEINGVGKGSLTSAMGTGALLGLTRWGMKAGGNAGFNQVRKHAVKMNSLMKTSPSGVRAVSHATNRFLYKGAKLTKSVGNSKLIAGALGVAAVSQGVSFTNPVNR